MHKVLRANTRSINTQKLKKPLINESKFPKAILNDYITFAITRI